MWRQFEMRRESRRSATGLTWLSSCRLELRGDEIAHGGHLEGKQSAARRRVDCIPGSVLQHQTRERLLERIGCCLDLRFEGRLGDVFRDDLSGARGLEHPYDLAR